MNYSNGQWQGDKGGRRNNLLGANNGNKTVEIGRRNLMAPAAFPNYVKKN